MKNLLMLLVLIVLASSCTTTKLTSSKTTTTTKDSTVAVKDSVKVGLTADSVKALVDVLWELKDSTYHAKCGGRDTVFHCPEKVIKAQTIVQKNKSGTMEAKIEVTKSGQIKVDCMELPRILKAEIIRQDHYIKTQTLTIEKYKEEKTRLAKIIDDIENFGIGLIVLVVIVGFFILRSYLK